MSTARLFIRVSHEHSSKASFLSDRGMDVHPKTDFSFELGMDVHPQLPFWFGQGLDVHPWLPFIFEWGWMYIHGMFYNFIRFGTIPVIYFLQIMLNFNGNNSRGKQPSSN